MRRMTWVMCLLAAAGLWACDDEPASGGSGDAATDGSRDMAADAIVPSDRGRPDTGPPADQGADQGGPVDQGVDQGAPGDQGVDQGRPDLGGPDMGDAPCLQDEDCLDENPCTTDTCGPDGQCAHDVEGGCCVQDADCGQDALCIPGLLICVGAPASGALVITELLPDPEAVADAAGEWIEVFNRGDAPIYLNGFTLAGGEGESHLIAADRPLEVPPGAWRVLTREADRAANGGVDSLYTYGGFSLSNGGDRVALVDPFGGLVDEVVYGDGWPVSPGASLSLDPAQRTVLANDLPEAWCAGQAAWADGADRGTPGAANPACPLPDVTVDWCRLQFPLDLEAPAGEVVTFYGRVFEAGITDRSDATDVDPALIAQLGVGPDGVDPTVDPAAWDWIRADANPGWDAVGANEPGNDEYQATRPAPAPGAYDFAFRFSRDEGRTWTYCDRAAGPGADGAEDGYQVANAGALVTVPGPCDGVVCDQPPAARCTDRFTRVAAEPIGACAVVDGAPACTYADAAPEDCRAGGDRLCLDGVCVDAPPRPAAGEVVVTEIMYDTEAPLSENDAEWIEVQNITDHPVRLDGCTLRDSANQAAIAELTVGAGGYALFARSADPALNGGLPAVAGIFGFGLNNPGDTVALHCGDIIVDSVVYGAGFPVARAASLSLDPAATAADANDDGARWCLGEAIYFGADATAHRGTPGAANPPCPQPDVTIDWCRLQFPLDAEAPAGSSVTVYGRVYEAGVTDRSPQNDAEEDFIGQVGIGAAGVAPDATWQWIDGAFNPGWDGAAAGEPDNDEWAAELPVPGPGQYAFAWRFSRDGGQTWLLCDRAAGPGRDGAEDGFQLDQAGTLASLASPCEGVVCDSPAAPTCDGDVRVVPRGPGRCEVQGDQGVCLYPADREDCALDGARCAAGACVGGPQPPVPGQLVVTEIMYDTEAPLGEAQAEWFEVQNVSAEPLRLTGCLLRDAGSQAAVGPYVLAPGAFAVFARNADPAVNGGLPPVAGTFGFGLNNPGDTVAIACGGVVIDTVSYGPGFPPATRRSLSLDPAATDAALNDAGAAWCVGSVPYFAGDNAAQTHFGTPGAANPPCPVVDLCDPNPCAVAPPPVCEGPASRRVYEAPGACAVVDGAAECTFDSLLVPCPEGEACADGVCAAGEIPAPAAGEVIFTELMYDPHFDLLDASAEWLELTNIAAGPRRLAGCVLSDPGAQTALDPFVLAPGDAIVLAVSLDPALNGDLGAVQLMGFGLGNGGERVALTCGGVLVDAVAYDDVAPWPTGARAYTLSLDPAAYDAAANDDGAAWCLGRPVYYDDPDGPAGDNHGSPGARNPPCDQLAEFGRLQFPLAIQGAPDVEVPIFGRVYHPGLTDRSTVTDASPLLRAQLGLGPDGALPAEDPAAFTWINASPNAGYDGANVGEPDNDEYVVNFRLPAAAGRYDYAWRFSADGGRTWRYADGQAAGSSDGYQLENAGDLLVEGAADPCDPNPCVPPDPVCVDGVTLRVTNGPGVCMVVVGEARCTFDQADVPCDPGDVCQGGACVPAGPPAPAEGEVIFTEVMYDPHFDIADATGEWIEVRNIADGPRTLTGCLLGDAGATLALPELVLPPGGFALFANSDDPALNGGLPAPAAVFRFALGNGGDTVRLLCNDVLIDTVTYDDGGEFPNAQARSISLDPGLEDAAQNDDGASWCLARDVFYADPDGPAGNNHGTPGAENPPCAVAVQFARLQFPLEIQGAQDQDVLVYARVYQAGITDRTTATDASPLLRVQVGYGADATLPDPATWTWINAFPNQGYDGALAGERDNDEYQAMVRLPPPGRYDHAIRVSADGGFSWMYADGQPAGSSDGYQIENAGDLFVGDQAARVAREGQVIISEILYDPAGVPDDLGQWIELFNPTDRDLDLTTCYLEDETRVQAPLDGVIVPAFSYAVVARALDPAVNGGVQAAATFPFALDAGGDTVSLVCRFEVDRVAYDVGLEFPAASGTSIQVDVAHQTLRENDQGGYWCEGAAGGTPGGANRDCGPLQGFSAERMQAIFDVHCDGCHTHGAVTEGLSLDGFEAQTFNVPSVQLPAMPLITPGDRRQSYLYYKLSGEHFQLPGGQGVWMPPAVPFPPTTIERFGLFIDGLR